METAATPPEIPYKPPDSLPAPAEAYPSGLALSIFAGVGMALVGGALLFGAGRLFYVYILYNSLLGIAIGKAIATGLGRGKVANVPVLFVLSGVCSVLAYVAYNFTIVGYILYKRNVGLAELSPQDWLMAFYSILVARAKQEPFLNGMQIGAIGNSVVWLAECSITGYYAWNRVSAAALVSQIQAVPMEVIEVVSHFVHNGRDDDSIRQELSNRGWTNPADQERALAAHQAYDKIMSAPG